MISGLVGMMAAWNWRRSSPRSTSSSRSAASCAGGHVLVLLREMVVRGVHRPVRKFLDSYVEMTADLTLLLATLAIMTGALVITGVPTKLGALLIEAAGVNLAAMVVLAFIFGACSAPACRRRRPTSWSRS